MNLSHTQTDLPAEPSIETFDPGILTHKIEAIALRAVTDSKAIQRSLPDVAAHVLELCQLSYTDAARVEKAVSKDPFISGQLVSVPIPPCSRPGFPSSGCATLWCDWVWIMCATSS